MMSDVAVKWGIMSLVCVFLLSISAAQQRVHAEVIDNFNDGVFSAHWKQGNYPQYGELGDTTALSETQSPGLLRAVHDDTQGSPQVSFVLRDDVQLTQVNDYVQVSVRLAAGAGTLDVAPGICLATQSTGINQDRSNTAMFTLRNDALARANAYGMNGVEISDPALAISSYQAGEWVKLRITRDSASVISFAFNYHESGWITCGVADYTGHVMPVVPGLMFANGLADYTAEFEDFIVGNTDREIDDFNDGVFSSHWKQGNYPQYEAQGDTIALSETQSPGLLQAVYDDRQGSAQISFVLRDDVQLDEVHDYVQVSVRIAAGAGTPDVAPGICLATQSTGINQDRSNTAMFVLRNNGLARANAYGINGVETFDPAQELVDYQSGDWVKLRIVRDSASVISFAFRHHESGWITCGTADYAGHVMPLVPGLMFANGLADYTAEFDDFLVGNTDTDPPPTPTPEPRQISLIVPNDLTTLPPIPSTRHQVNFPTGQGDNTYHHGALIVHWKNAFYTAWTSTPASECTTPYIGLLSKSSNGQVWSTPMTMGSAAENATYEAYLRAHHNIPAGRVELNQAPRGFHATEDKLYLWSLAWMNTATGQESAGRIFETSDGNNWTEIPPETLLDYENNQGLGSLRNTGSNHGFHRLRDGRLFAFNLASGGPRFPTTLDPTGLTQWTGPIVDPGDCGDVGEPGGYEGPDGVLHGTARCTTGYVWHTYSENGGISWTPLIQQDQFTDNPGNKDWGVLPDGSVYYVGGPKPGSRQQLVLGISRDGWTFDENYLIRGEAIQPIWYSLCKSEDRPGWEYPSATYYNGFLYVAYSRTRDFIEVSKVDLKSIIRTEANESWTLYGYK